MADNQATQRAAALVVSREEQAIARTVVAWLNTCPEIGLGEDAIRYETLDEGSPGWSMHVEPGSRKTRQFITGGYEAQLKLSLWRRIQPGDSGDARLAADEALNALGDWASENGLPALGGGLRAKRVEINERGCAKAAYDNGDEDHRTLLTLIYEKF